MSDVTYFEDPQLDRAVGLVFELASELHVTTQRLHALEALLTDAGVLGKESLDAFQPNEAQDAALGQVRDAMMARLLRVVTEDGPATHPLREELMRAPRRSG